MTRFTIKITKVLGSVYITSLFPTMSQPLSESITIMLFHSYNVKELHSSRLHWRVPFIADLSETVQVVW